MVRVVLLPAFTEKVLVLIENSVLVPLHRAIPVTFSVVVPVFWMVTVSCRFVPTFTLPKATGFGVAEIVGMAATPVPLRFTLYVAFAGSFVVNA